MNDDAARTAAQQFVVDQVSRLVTTEDWQAMLADAGRFREYSPRNTLLLVLQGAHGRVAGYRAWQSIPSADGGYCQVRQGARALKILAPILTRQVVADAATGEERAAQRPVGFRLVSVFDETQLVVPPEPPKVMPLTLDGAAPAALDDALTAQIRAAGFEVVERDVSPANGMTDFETRTVAIHPDFAGAQRIKTLVHELAHVYLHEPSRRPDGMTRPIAEVEAESVAFVVLAGLGIDASNYTLPYVARWADGNPDLIAATATRVVDAARVIGDALTIFLDQEQTMTLDVADDTLEWSIETRVGAWQIGPRADGDGLLAQHIIDGVAHLEVGRDASIRTVADLETAFGFAIPQALADDLRATLGATQSTATVDAVLPARLELTPAERPADTSVVATNHSVLGHYRALLDGEALDRHYKDDAVTIETWALNTTGLAAYRIQHAGDLVASGEIALGDHDPASDAAIRAIAAAHTRDDALGDNVRVALLSLATPAAEPFTAGTRIAVDVADDQMLGTVVSALVDARGTLAGYEWRPDVAELMGHPWREHAHTRTAPAAHVQPTLLPPDRGLRIDRALCFGASVRIDDHAYMVLRCFEPTDGGFQFDVQPVDGGQTRRVTAREIAEVIAGTAWRDVEAVLAERQRRDVRALPGERIDTAREVVWVDQRGTLVDQRDATVEIAPSSDVARSRAPVAPDRELPPPAVVRIDFLGDTARIGDPRHGWIEVDRSQFLAAFATPATQLAAQLRASNTIDKSLDGHEPHVTLAALAAQHLDVGSLTPTRPSVSPPVREVPTVELSL